MLAYMITHFYEGGTKDQYEAVLAAVHPDGGLPEGQTHHFAGATDGGYLVVAIWDSKESNDRFIEETLMPALPKVQGGFDGPPQERTAQVENHVTA